RVEIDIARRRLDERAVVHRDAAAVDAILIGRQPDQARAAARDAGFDDDMVRRVEQDRAQRADDVLADRHRAQGRDVDLAQGADADDEAADVADLEVAVVVEPDAAARDRGFEPRDLRLERIRRAADAE